MITQLEENVINSFRIAKSDIIKLQSDFLCLSETQERMMEMIQYLRSVNTELQKKLDVRKTPKKIVVTKKVVVNGNKKRTHYVASENAKKFHIVECPYAQNIKPKSMINFKSKVKALNEGLKPCRCVK